MSKNKGLGLISELAVGAGVAAGAAGGQPPADPASAGESALGGGGGADAPAAAAAADALHPGQTGHGHRTGAGDQQVHGIPDAGPVYPAAVPHAAV